MLNTGAPQGCGPSPFLFIIYTNDFCASQAGCLILKYADDTVVLGLIDKGDKTNYRIEIEYVIDWCNTYSLLLNASKTKELVFDFRQRPTCQLPVFINETGVEIAHQYKYLGVTVDDKFNWDYHVKEIQRKGQQRLYFLRKLKTFNMDTCILELFYTSLIQSAITYAFVCWWNSLSVKNKNKVDRIKKTAQRIIGTSLTNLNVVYKDKALSKLKQIMEGNSVFRDKITWLRSGKRLMSLKCKTSRYFNSFVPNVVRLYNMGNEQML